MSSVRRSPGESGSALVVTLLVMVLLFLLGAALLTMSDIENQIASNDRFSEGAFYAAESAVQGAIDQIQADPDESMEAVPVTQIGGQFTYRTGGRLDAGPQPVEYIRATPGAGYSLGAGTGYNSVGYVFHTYQITATGSGPRNTQREVEVQVDFGPVAN
jgi:Tfp pilus assembly protein PilX